MGSIGNKNALGNEGGRPPKHDRMKIVKEFVEWARNTPDAFTVPQFANTLNITSGDMRRWAQDDIEFSSAFQLGKELIGYNRLRATQANKENGERQLEKSIYLQTIGNYDMDIRAYQREDKEFEYQLKMKLMDHDHKLKQQETKHVSEDIMKSFNQLSDQINKAQSSALNMEDKISNNESKS